MNELDNFAESLIEEAKRFLERANEHKEEEGKKANLHAALMIGFCALEAHVNSIIDDFINTYQNLTVHDKGILCEREVRLNDKGVFELTKQLKMTRMEDRILFLHRRFSGKSLDRNSAWWSDLIGAIKHRNSLTHPKESHSLTLTEVARSLQAIIDTINALYLACFNRAFPMASRGIQSTLTF